VRDAFFFPAAALGLIDHAAPQALRCATAR
jgi:hypothetical protein